MEADEEEQDDVAVGADVEGADEEEAADGMESSDEEDDTAERMAACGERSPVRKQ